VSEFKKILHSKRDISHLESNVLKIIHEDIDDGVFCISGNGIFVINYGFIGSVIQFMIFQLKMNPKLICACSNCVFYSAGSSHFDIWSSCSSTAQMKTMIIDIQIKLFYIPCNQHTNWVSKVMTMSSWYRFYCFSVSAMCALLTMAMFTLDRIVS